MKHLSPYLTDFFCILLAIFFVVFINIAFNFLKLLHWDLDLYQFNFNNIEALFFCISTLIPFSCYVPKLHFYTLYVHRPN